MWPTKPEVFTIWQQLNLNSNGDMSIAGITLHTTELYQAWSPQVCTHYKTGIQ